MSVVAFADATRLLPARRRRLLAAAFADRAAAAGPCARLWSELGMFLEYVSDAEEMRLVDEALGAEHVDLGELRRRYALRVDRIEAEVRSLSLRGVAVAGIVLLARGDAVESEFWMALAGVASLVS